MVFIFCGSYLSVVETIKAINEEQNNFVVLSADASMMKLFSQLYSPKNVFLLPESVPDFSTPFKLIRSVINIQRKKKEVLSSLAEFNPHKVIFFFLDLTVLPHG